MIHIRILCLAVLACFVCICQGGSNVNLALNKPAFQSSTFVPTRGYRHVGPFKAAFSVDGNHNTNPGKGSCSQTKKEFQPWWAVDLGREMCVGGVTFVNRGDCCGRRARDFIIGITKKDPTEYRPRVGRYTQCGQWKGNVAKGATVQMQCDRGRRGRYVIVQLPRIEMLNFCELEVYGCGFQTTPAPTPAPTTTPTPTTTPPGVCNCRGGSNVNLALKKPAFQISTYDPRYKYGAVLSVDGNRNTNIKRGSCSHTKLEDNPWWAVDIGRQICVDRVVFVNRGDCCGYRSNDFIIGVTNDSPKSHPPTIGGYTQCGQWNGKVGSGATVELRCDKVARGRYIIVQVPHQTILNFCELEVYGCA